VVEAPDEEDKDSVDKKSKESVRANSNQKIMSFPNTNKSRATVRPPPNKKSTITDLRTSK